MKTAETKRYDVGDTTKCPVCGKRKVIEAQYRGSRYQFKGLEAHEADGRYDGLKSFCPGTGTDFGPMS